VAYLIGSCLGSVNVTSTTPASPTSTLPTHVWMASADGVSDVNPYAEWCARLAVVVHYLLLTSMCWMLVEAVHMYQLLITVFANSETSFMLKRTLAAWGVPLVVVLSTALTDMDYYHDSSIEGCRLAPRYPAVYYATMVGPACLILLINTVVFFVVLKVILQQGKRARATGKVGCGVGNDKSASVSMAQLRGAVTVMALLGVTWISGALAIGPFKVALQYVFCVCSSLQGFVIFLVRVIQYPEARMSMRTLWTTGRTRIRSTHSFSNSHTHLQGRPSSKSTSARARYSSKSRLRVSDPSGGTGGSGVSGGSGSLPAGQQRSDLSYTPVPTAK